MDKAAEPRRASRQSGLPAGRGLEGLLDLAWAWGAQGLGCRTLLPCQALGQTQQKVGN